MDEEQKKTQLAEFLKAVPTVGFSCVYGSTLHPNNTNKGSMVDYILGVADPLQWHSQNLKLNPQHYASWMLHLGGAKLVTEIADEIGVGVHFNPYVAWNNKMVKYGVVRMHDLIQDILTWDRFYLSGRLQKPVHILSDNLDVRNVNTTNMRAATAAALLLLPPKFSEVRLSLSNQSHTNRARDKWLFLVSQEDLYAKICSLSYMGDLRMLFAEDKNKVKKIVRGQFSLFQSMYKPLLEEYESRDLIRFSSSSGGDAYLHQDIDLLKVHSLVSSLPPTLRNQMGRKLGEQNKFGESGCVLHEVMISSREETSKSMEKVLRRRVMISSARQAVSGLLTAGGVNAARYLASKMSKAWKSWR